MLVPFTELSDSARVWIYQANRSFSKDELVEITRKLEDFITQWAAHGADLKAGYEIKYKRFIVLAVDNNHNNASGCSIDASVRFIQQLENDYEVDLMDKMNVSFKSGAFVAYKSLLDFKKMVKSKAVSEKTIVFNNLVNNIAEYKSNWEVPITESWHNRFLK